MEILNKRTTYEVKATEGTMTLTGHLYVKEGKITEANLQATTGDGKSASYSRNAGDNYSESLCGDASIIDAVREACVTQLSDFETTLNGEGGQQQ